MRGGICWILTATLATMACGGETDSSPGASGGSATGGGAGSTGGSGGLATGGSATGGSATGGSATGGSATGGAAGAGGTAGASSGGSAGVGDAGSCQPLLSAYQLALSEAVACNPALSVIQCSGSATLPDPCDCMLVANETQGAKVEAAKSAREAWVKAGCGPWACGKACFEGPSGVCDPNSGSCQWKGN